MKVTIVRGGGLLGLVATTTADSASLSPEKAEALRRKVEETKLLELAVRGSAPSPQPDAFDYEVTVENGEGSMRVVFAEHQLPSGVRSFISWLDSLPGRQESLGPPGPAA